MPPVDSRNNGPKELTEEEVQHEIFKRQERAKRAKNQTKGGILIGIVGTAVAAQGAFRTDNIWMTVIGFVMALIGFGFSSPKEAADMVRGLLGRGSKD
jgi:hypothetical protein